MPTNYVKTIADKAGKSVQEVEKYWKEAKEIAKKHYGEGSDKFWGTVTKVFKNKVNKHLGLSESTIINLLEGRTVNNFEKLLEGAFDFRMGYVKENTKGLSWKPFVDRGQGNKGYRFVIPPDEEMGEKYPLTITVVWYNETEEFVAFTEKGNKSKFYNVGTTARSINEFLKKKFHYFYVPIPKDIEKLKKVNL